MSKGGINIQIPFDPVNFDVEAFDSFIKANGVQFYHYKAVRCPLGMIDLMSIRSPHHEHGICSNGYIYKLAGVVSATISMNSAVTSLSEVGIIDGSVLNVTFPRFYDDCPDKQVYIQEFDRFYIKDLAVLVPHSQLIEHHVSGTDKLTFKAECVEFLIDNHGKEYLENVDFVIQEGNIKWISSNTPGYDIDLGKGIIYTVRYLFTPYFYVQKLLHEVRLAQKFDFQTQTRVPVRAPYAALLAREFYQYKDENSSMQPESSMFGPR